METNAAEEHAAIIAPVAAENLAKPSKPSATTKVWTAQMKVYSTRRYLGGGAMCRESESRRQERSREVVRSTRADARTRARLSTHSPRTRFTACSTELGPPRKESRIEKSAANLSKEGQPRHPRPPPRPEGRVEKGARRAARGDRTSP